MKIRFLRTSKYKSAVKGIPAAGQLSYSTTTYEHGKVYDLPDDQAGRWIRRQAAEEVAATAKPETPVQESSRPIIAQGAHLKTTAKP